MRKRHGIPEKPNHSSGLFFFFIVGLFVLQTIFAFKIHGDIGSTKVSPPNLDRPTSLRLLGKIDTVVNNNQKRIEKKVPPEVAMAPANKQITHLSNHKTKMNKPADNLATTSSLKQTENRFLEYTICQGDTLQKISKKLCGSSRMVPVLIRINRVRDTTNLQCGSCLLIPPKAWWTKVGYRSQ